MGKKFRAYIGLILVVLVWGLAPLVTLELYKFYSPTVRVFLSEIILIVSYLVISGKKIKIFNLDYIKVGIPTGLFLALANISQKIGLPYTTPAKYAFLENLSCITVPVVMYILVKKKPGIMTVISCFVCLAGIFVLSGVSLSDASMWGMGETLCAVSGLLYGFNIAGTAVFAKKLYPPLYLAVQSAVSVVVSFFLSIILDRYPTSANPIEKIMYSVDIKHIVFLILSSVIISAICWIIRTDSMKYIDASAVSIIMPFSSVVTGVVSVMLGKDVLNMNLVLGGILGVAAIMMSCWDDIRKN